MFYDNYNLKNLHDPDGLNANYYAAVICIVENIAVGKSLCEMKIWDKNLDKPERVNTEEYKGARAFVTPPKKTLERLHVSEKLTLYEISEMYGVNRVTVGKWFKDRGIKVKKIRKRS